MSGLMKHIQAELAKDPDRFWRLEAALNTWHHHGGVRNLALCML